MTMTHNESDLQQNQTLTRGFQILEMFQPDHPTWGVRELSRELRINPTTVFRLLKTLVILGYVKQDPATERYSLGDRIMKLAAVYSHHNPLPTVARQVFERYADRFEYNFYFGNLNQHEVIYLAVLDARGPLKIMVEPGRTIPLHTTALGKVLLAFQDDAYIQDFLERATFRAHTSRSITDPAILRQQIDEVRRNEYAVNAGEHYEDIGAVAVPVRNHRGTVIAGVSLGYPMHLVQEGRLDPEALIRMAREIASEITRRAGTIAL